MKITPYAFINDDGVKLDEGWEIICNSVSMQIEFRPVSEWRWWHFTAGFNADCGISWISCPWFSAAWDH